MKKILIAVVAAALLCPVSAGVQTGAATPTTIHVDSASNAAWGITISIENVSWASFLDGQGRQRRPVVYEGSVYIPLRTAADWMGAQTAWDQANQTVTLTSDGVRSYLDIFTLEGQPPMTVEETEGYLQEVSFGAEAELRSDIKFVLDGVEQTFTNARGEAVYPLVIRQCIYLPIRSVGAMSGKEVLWLRESGDTPGEVRSNRIYVYDPMTSEQQAAAVNYFAQCAEKLVGLQVELDDLAKAQELTEETFRGRLGDLKALVVGMRDMPCPDVPILEYDCNAVRHACDRLIYDNIMPYLNPEIGLRPEFVDAPWQEHRKRFLQFTREGDGMRLLDNAIVQSQRLVDALIA